MNYWNKTTGLLALMTCSMIIMIYSLGSFFDLETDNTALRHVKFEISRLRKQLYGVEDGIIDEPAKFVINDTTQTPRISTIKSVCQAYPRLSSLNFPVQGILYNNGPFYYCNVAKLGSTFHEELFPLVLNCPGINKKSNPKLQIPKSVFSYLTVGDPYNRLLSAYKNKLLKPDVEFWDFLGKDIVKTVRKEEIKEESGRDVTFKEVVEYVVNHHEKQLQTPLDHHLQSIHKLCNPCKIRFDFIGRTDTLSDDLVSLFDTLKQNGIVKKDVPISKHIDNVVAHQKPLYGSVPRLFHAVKKYPNMSTYNLFLRHWSTYHMAGTILNQYEMPFSETAVKTVSLKLYKNALTDAIAKSQGSKEQLKLQRREALIQAYRTVPLQLMYRLREYLKTDCLLFSYDDKPDYLFNRDTFNASITHLYMKGI